MKRLIVSGAGGFLGENLVNSAKDSGITVMAITSQMLKYNDIEVLETTSFLKNGYLFSPDDVFINCMFPTNADGYKMADGLDKVYKLIFMAYVSGAESFINISSQSVYDSKREKPAKEDDELCLDTPYSVGKYSSEMYVNHVFNNRPHTNIRMASLIGVGYEQRIINRLVAQVFKGEVISVKGGMQRYGFLDVRDAADGLIKLSQSNSSAWKETYNLGRNGSCTLIELAKCICAEIKSNTDKDPEYLVSEGNDTRNSALDATLFMNEFCWEPKISLQKSVKDIILSATKAKADT